MFRRTFQGNAPHITFTRAFQQTSFGNLAPGQTVRVSYDPHRLGPRPWDVTVYHQFAQDGPILTKRLDMPTGQIVTRIADDPYEATYMTAAIDIPEDAEMVILWFGDGERWDSAHGANYWFRFTATDIQGENATVADGKFEVSLTALPGIEDVTVHFKVINNPPGEPFTGSVPLDPGGIEEGRRGWAVSGIDVPQGANVRFTFTYKLHGRTFTDDNDGAGFFAPKPESTHNPRKFAAARAEAPVR